MAGFHATLDELWDAAAPRSILDVGCGEGVLTEQWAERLGDGRIVGIDLDDPKLRAEWEHAPRPNLEFRAEEATSLSFARRRVRHGGRDRGARARAGARGDARRDGARGERHLLVSVPREPLWRGLNMARGAYLRRPRQHAGPREPLVEARLRVAAVALRDGRGGALAVPVDDGARPRR